MASPESHEHRTVVVSRVLVANRGEIARRIIATVHAMGLDAAAVFSDADADAVHVLEADVGVHLGGVSASDTYLNQPALIEAARSVGADAIHPGYGFLAENADFARAVSAAGLTWIGPCWWLTVGRTWQSRWGTRFWSRQQPVAGAGGCGS